MGHEGCACHRNIADGTQTMILGIAGTLANSIVPYETRRSIATTEDIVDIETDGHMLDTTCLGNL